MIALAHSCSGQMEWNWWNWEMRWNSNAWVTPTADVERCVVDETRKRVITFLRSRGSFWMIYVSPSATSTPRGCWCDVRCRASSAIGTKRRRRWLRLESFFLVPARRACAPQRATTASASLRRPGISAHARRAHRPVKCLVRTRRALAGPSPSPSAISNFKPSGWLYIEIRKWKYRSKQIIIKYYNKFIIKIYIHITKHL